MTIKELFGHAIGVVKFGDIAKFYNWLTKRDHTLKGDITFTGTVDFTDATVSGLSSSGGDGIYGGSGVVSDGTYATLEGAFRFQTEAEDDNYLSIAPYEDGLRFDFLITSVDYDQRVEVTLNPEEAAYIAASSISIPGKSTALSTHSDSIWLAGNNGSMYSGLGISDGQISIDISGDTGTSGQVLKKDVNNEVAWGDPRPYKVYSALLSQRGNSAPTSVILENTFPSAIVWSYSSIGYFVGTLTAAFVENKTQCWIEQSSTDTAPGTFFKRIVRTGANTVEIYCSDGLGNPLNDVIVDTPIEIRVYN